MKTVLIVQGASRVPWLRSRFSEILDVALLRLRFRKPCGLAQNRDLPSTNENCFDYAGGASCGLRLCSRLFQILDGVPLRLRFEKACGLAQNRDLPSANENCFG
jgi:hypothetical protein